MKTIKHFLPLLVFSLFVLLGTGCRVQSPTYHKRGVIISTHPQGKIPPGQLKKMTGAQSAKAYAPGQNKKHKKYKGK